jgi:Rad3-related DNA helicase
VALNSSYGNRDCSRFKHDLCAVVHAVAEATRGGVLVFFPSHASMKGITDEWRKYGGYRDLEAVKSVYTEPRTAQEFQQAHSLSFLLHFDFYSAALPCLRCSWSFL